jgi:hypothetical protein
MNLINMINKELNVEIAKCKIACSTLKQIDLKAINQSD